MTRDDLILQIDNLHAKRTQLLASAQEALDLEKFFREMGNPEEWRSHAEMADRLLREARHIEDVDLKILGEKLAEAQTMELKL